MKNKNGITLIALIITIIILLILAMVTINILINQGIIGHAQNAVETYDEKQVKEDIALSYDEYKMQKFGANAKSLYDFFKDKYGADHVTDNGDGSITVSVTSNGKTYTVKLKEDGSMESMSGLSLDKSSITLEYEDGTPATGTITATLTDISGDVKWSIADNTIATISATTGNQITVTSVKSGTTTITATCGKYTKTCEVKVYEKLPIGEYINYKCYSTVADEDKSKLIHTASKEQTGYDIDQEYQVTEDVKWKILGRDNDGNILIITADSMESKTKGYLYSKGKTGYMYLPDELDAISKIYGFGQHAIGARSIKVEDVNTIQEYKPGVQKKYTYMKSADDGYVLSECCKLISFSREILIGRYEDVSEVATIQLKVESRIGDVQNQIDSFSALADSEEDAKKKKEMKLKVKVAKKSIKYLSRTSDELKKAIKAYKPGKKKPLALPDKSEE